MATLKELEGSADGTATDLAEVVAQLQFNEQGLIPAIAQDYESGAVLMLAWMDKHAIQRSLDEGFAVYYSRSRQATGVRAIPPEMCKNWSVCLSTATAIRCCYRCTKPVAHAIPIAAHAFILTCANSTSLWTQPYDQYPVPQYFEWPQRGF